MWDTKQKYVRLEQYDEIIIFPTTIEHSTFRHLKPISAGFCRVHSDKVVCFGDSYALSLESKEDDTAIATSSPCSPTIGPPLLP